MSHAPTKPTAPVAEPAPALVDVQKQLTRMESKLVQLMKHVGMTTDGRKPLRKERT